LNEEKGFLSRWSDRKLNVEPEGTEPPSSESLPEKKSEEEFEGKTDEEILSILELPEPETLKLGDTVEKFMDGRVPERIRLRALRAFWKTNPVLANIDGLDEYCEDYTDAALVVENLQTIYQVGKGYAVQALDALESLAEDDAIEAIESVDQSIANRDTQKLESKDQSENEFAESTSSPDPEENESDQKRAEADVRESVAAVVPGARRMQFQ
jgi:hypothetical protein